MDNDDYWKAANPRKPLWDFGSPASNRDDSGIMSELSEDEERGSIDDQPSGVTRRVKSLEAARRPLQPSRSCFIPVILALIAVTMIVLGEVSYRELAEPFTSELTPRVESEDRKFFFKLSSGKFVLRSRQQSSSNHLTISGVFTNQESNDTEIIALKTQVSTNFCFHA